MLLALAALATIFCGLVSVLLLYNHFQAVQAERCPQANGRKVLAWLKEKGLRLPSSDEILSLLEPSMKKLEPVEEGIQWEDLRVEKLLPKTKLPEIQITSIKSMEARRVVLDCLVEWSECMPGFEVTVKVEKEKVTCHLQIDWIIMQGVAELKESVAGEGLMISWKQTQRQRSGLSCMAVDPSHWTLSIDALPSEDERTKKCEELASAVAEAFHRLLANLSLDEVFIPVQPPVLEQKHDHTLSSVVDQPEASSEISPKKSSNKEEESERLVGRDDGDVTIEKEVVQKHKAIPEIQLEELQSINAQATALPKENTSPSEQSPKPITVHVDTVQHGNGSVPAANLPLQEAGFHHHAEKAPEPNQSKVGKNNQDNLAEEEEQERNELNDVSPLSFNHQSSASSPLLQRIPSWRRTPSYEQLETISPLDPALTLPTTPTDHRSLSHSFEQLSGVLRSGEGLSRNSMTLSMRSYDSRSTLDDMLTSDGSRIPSTLVFEVTEGTTQRYIAALTASRARQLKKEHPSYTKLHIYNDHSFTATHIKNRLMCVVCKEKISGMFGKQCYTCRDCNLTVHKQCHYKVETVCANPTFVTWKIEYPDDHPPSSPQHF